MGAKFFLIVNIFRSQGRFTQQRTIRQFALLTFTFYLLSFMTYKVLNKASHAAYI